jgi:hypothetical protein
MAASCVGVGALFGSLWAMTVAMFERMPALFAYALASVAIGLFGGFHFFGPLATRFK